MFLITRLHKKLYYMNFKQICIFIRISTKKQAFDFSKKNSYTNSLFKIPLWLEIDNATSYFLISSKHFKTLYLSCHWFSASRTREFELVTRGFELVTRGFELVTRRFELVTRGFELVTHGFELVTRESGLVTGGFELTLLNFNSCF